MVNEPHKVLGVSENATQDEIKKAYRQMAKKYHPDLNPGDENAAKKMNEINEAYDMLMNPEKYRNQRAAGSYGGYNPGGYNTYSGQQGRTYRTYTYGNGPFGGWTYTNVDFDDFFGGSYSNTNADFYNIKVEETDSYDFRKAIMEIGNRKFSDALNSLARVPSYARKARWYYISAVANYGAGNTVQASAVIQKAVNEDPGNQVYRAAYQQINRSSQTYQRNARTYQSNFGGLGGLCCSMALSQMLCGHPCFFCFC